MLNAASQNEMPPKVQIARTSCRLMFDGNLISEMGLEALLRHIQKTSS
jgi:hypothetical protein